MNPSQEKLRCALEYLRVCDEDSRVKILQSSLSFLLDSTLDYQGSLSEISRGSSLNAVDFKMMSQGVLVLYGESLQHGSDNAFLKRKCSELGLQFDISSTLIQVWTLNAPTTAKYLLSKIVTQNQLIDLEWSFGVTSSTDDCDTVGKTFLQLKLVIGDNVTSPRNLFIELSLESFFQLLASLEKCKQFVDYVSTR